MTDAPTLSPTPNIHEGVKPVKAEAKDFARTMVEGAERETRMQEAYLRSVMTGRGKPTCVHYWRAVHTPFEGPLMLGPEDPVENLTFRRICSKCGFAP